MTSNTYTRPLRLLNNRLIMFLLSGFNTVHRSPSLSSLRARGKRYGLATLIVRALISGSSYSDFEPFG